MKQRYEHIINTRSSGRRARTHNADRTDGLILKTTPYMFRTLTTAIMATLAAGSAFAHNSGEVTFATLNDSTSYVRVEDPDSIALALDIKISYTLPVSGIHTIDLIKMSDMLMGITGVGFDAEGYPGPSDMTQYDGGRWMAANDSSAAAVRRFIADSAPADIYYMLWSEEPAISPLYNKDGKLSMLASNYAYTGGAHGIYREYCVNYSVSDGKFVHLKDIFPGLDTPTGKKAYNNVLKPILTAKAEKVLAGSSMSLLTDEVEPTGNFSFSDTGIVLRYQPYQIASWAAGVVEVPLTWHEIADIKKAAGF